MQACAGINRPLNVMSMCRSTKIQELSIRDCRTLIADGVIAGGMIPKVRFACVDYALYLCVL